MVIYNMKYNFMGGYIMFKAIKKPFCYVLTILLLASLIVTVPQVVGQNTTVANAATVSATQTQTKNIVSKATGQVIGTLTLHYQTQIIGGRPQFIYDKCAITFSFTSWYRGNVYLNSFTGDYIEFKVDYAQFIDSGYTYIGFTP
jgi:hypothetical protein